MSGPWVRLSGAAWLAAFTHVLAGLALLLVLRHGLETTPSLEARLRFIAEHQALWTAGWLTWNAAALSILYFCVAFAAAHSADRERAPFWFAVALCAAAVACDLGAESVFMGVLVELARPSLDELSRGAPGAASRFLLWQRSAVMLTGYMANGLYTGAILVLWWITRSDYRRLEVAAGLVLCLAGLALSAAALAGSVGGMFWANVVLLPSLVVWLIAIARHASRRSRAGATA